MMDKIEEQIKNSKRKNVIVSVSAASNVTSQLTDLKTLNAIIKKLRKVKNLIFAVDCAAYCCHHEFNVTELDEIDFAFISPHKNLGGAESCGLLLVKKSVISSSKPSFPGGGTVAMVKGYEDNDILYDTDLFNREVAGTPPFLGFYRAALSFELLKNDIGYDFIHEREKKNSEKFIGLLME
jgi:selenocysteine lyase/cysteine desulfurase